MSLYTWRQQSPDDQADMISHELIVRLRAAYQAEQAEDEGKKKDKGAPNAFEKMKAQMRIHQQRAGI